MTSKVLTKFPRAVTDFLSPLFRDYSTKNESHDYHMTVFPSTKPSGRHEAVALLVRQYHIAAQSSHLMTSSVTFCSTHLTRCCREQGYPLSLKTQTSRVPLRSVT